MIMRALIRMSRACASTVRRSAFRSGFGAGPVIGKAPTWAASDAIVTRIDRAGWIFCGLSQFVQKTICLGQQKDPRSPAPCLAQPPRAARTARLVSLFLWPISEKFDFGKVLPIFTIGEQTDTAYCLPYAQFLRAPLDPPRHRRGFLLPVALSSLRPIPFLHWAEPPSAGARACRC